MGFKSAITFVLFISLVTAQNHEKFWAEPEFFASLSDYLTTPQTQPVPIAPTERRRVDATTFAQQPIVAPIPRNVVPQIRPVPVTPSYQTFHIVQHQTWMNPRNPRLFQTPQTFQLPQPRPQIVVRNEVTPPQYLSPQPPPQMVMLPHPNALPTEQAKTRRRPTLGNKRKRLRTTTTTTTVKPDNSTTMTITPNNVTTTTTTTNSTPPPPTTTAAPEYYDDYSSEDIKNTAPNHAYYHPSPPPSPHSVHIHPHSQPHFTFTSNNAEILPARQVYDSSEQFGVRVPAPSSFHHQLPPPRALHHQLNPNILIATPHQTVQNPVREQLAQASNLFPVAEQDENFLGQANQQGTPPGLVTRISNILETGRKILYFPVGVVDVVDHALTYAEANPYVSYVMDTLADTILGSTKGMTAAPPQQQVVHTKPPQTLLIAAKLGEMKENLNKLQNAVASTMQPIKKL